MKILPPLLLSNSTIVTDGAAYLAAAQEAEEEISVCTIHEATWRQENFSQLRCREVVFDHCIFEGCTFAKSEFRDVIFRNCDLSNCDFSDSYWNRCVLLSCKGIGFQLLNSLWQDITVQDCNFQYSNISECKWKDVKLVASDFRNANLTECKWARLTLEDIHFQHASFFKTPLKGLDLRQCEITNLIVSGNEWPGAIITSLQAIEVAKFLGVVIKDD